MSEDLNSSSIKGYSAVYVHHCTASGYSTTLWTASWFMKQRRTANNHRDIEQTNSFRQQTCSCVNAPFVYERMSTIFKVKYMFITSWTHESVQLCALKQTKKIACRFWNAKTFSDIWGRNRYNDVRMIFVKADAVVSFLEHVHSFTMTM